MRLLPNGRNVRKAPEAYEIRPVWLSRSDPDAPILVQFCFLFAIRLSSFRVAIRACTVSFVGPTGVRHSIDVTAETLYEAAVMAIARFRQDIWGEAIGTGTILDVEVREPAAKHSLTLQQVERWLASPGSPYEASKKAKLKLMLVRG